MAVLDILNNEQKFHVLGFWQLEAKLLTSAARKE
jgi:hypothetical protein